MAKRYSNRILDISGGMRSGVSEYGIRPNFLSLAQNVEMRPFRAASVRKGSQRLSSGTLTEQALSIMEWVGAAGGGQEVYVGCDDGSLHRVGASSFTAQTTPFTMEPSAKLSWAQLNGALFVTENAGTNEPMFYRSSNTADTFLSMTYPTPDVTGWSNTTPGRGAGLGMAAGTYYYRLRHIFTDGSSPPSATMSATCALDDGVDIIDIPINPSGRTDYVGWTLERSMLNGSSAGPFYWVADGTGTSYNDSFVDADLGEQADDNAFGSIPDGHVDGIIAFNDRLVAWKDSTLYVSQSIADLFSSGICNWDARNAYDFGKDDGDDIKAVIRQSDRLLVLKENSVWAFEGNDPSNFSEVPLYTGAGCSGPRAATSMGQTAWFFGGAGLHRIDGNSIKPFGYTDVGDLLDEASDSRLPDAVLMNHAGQRLYVCFSSDSSDNNVMLVYDQRFGVWTRWTGWYIHDALVQKRSQYGDRGSFLFVDKRNRATLPAFDYRPFIGYYGTKDEKAQDGSGGSAITVTLTTPWYDDGAPDSYKSLERIEVYAQASGATLNVSIDTDPNIGVGALSIPMAVTAAVWNSLNWGAFNWGSASTETASKTGIMEGMFCRRYRLTFSVPVSTDFIFKGAIVDIVAQPERRYS